MRHRLRSLSTVFCAPLLCALCSCVLDWQNPFGGAAPASSEEALAVKPPAALEEISLPVPSGEPQETVRSGQAEFYDWLYSCSLDALRMDIQKAQPWAKEAMAFVRAALDAEAGASRSQSWTELANHALALEAKGCDSPVAKFWMGEALLRAGKPALAKTQLLKSAARLQDWSYPRLLLSMSSDRLAEACFLDESSQQSFAKAALNLAPDAMAGTIEDQEPFAPKSQFAVYAGLYELRTKDQNQKFWRSAADSASKAPKCSPWLLGMLKAQAEFEDAKFGLDSGDAAAKSAFGKALQLAKLDLSRPEPDALAISILAAFPSTAPAKEADRLLLEAAKRQAGYLPAYLAYIDYLAAGPAPQTLRLMRFGRLCLAAKRFDTQIPRVYLAALFKAASLEGSFDWRAPFLQQEVPTELERLYLGMLNAKAPDDNAARDVLAMERCLLMAWCGDYAAAKALSSKIPPEIALLNESFHDFRLAWKPQTLLDFEAELRAFTGAQKEAFVQWDAALRNSEPEVYTKQASKLIAGTTGDKPLRQLIRVRTAWRMAGVQAASLSLEDMRDPIVFALKNKRGDIIKFLLSNGYELKRKGPESSTPLLLAFANGLPEETVKQLVSKGADVDYVNPATGETPLILAIKGNMPLAAEFIAEMGADANAKLVESGKTPLHLAAEAGMAPLIKTLLRRNAKPNVQDLKGDTPMHSAARAGQSDCLRALIAKLADPTIKNFSGETPLDLASRRGDKETCEVLEGAIASLKPK